MKKTLLQFKNGHIATADKGLVSYLSSNPIINRVDITDKKNKEVEDIKKQLTKSFKDSKMKKADDVAAVSEKKTL